jgi:very-short-patch-repair endonuclease
MNMLYEQLAKERKLYYNGKHIPYNISLKGRAREFRNNPTQEERILWKIIRRLPFQVLRQRTIDHYIVDFYIPCKRLVIELDGGQHYSKEGLIRDEDRSKVLELYGLKILRFSNKEVRENAENIGNYVLSFPDEFEE